MTLRKHIGLVLGLTPVRTQQEHAAKYTTHVLLSVCLGAGIMGIGHAFASLGAFTKILCAAVYLLAVFGLMRSLLRLKSAIGC
jgi:uncharacterized membrane protein YiaA